MNFASMSEIRNSKIPSTRDVIDGRINSLSESLKRNPFEKNRKTGTVCRNSKFGGAGGKFFLY